MLHLSREQILSIFSMRDAIEAVRKAFVLHSEGRAKVPLRINMDAEDKSGQYIFMPSYVGGLNMAGVKVTSVFPGNAAKGIPVVPATFLLIDGATGLVTAIVEGTTLTQLRTGAISGVATELLSNPDSRVAALFGTGGQAPTQLEALMTVRNLSEVRVFGLNSERVREFVTRNQPLAGRFGTTLVEAKSAGQAVDGADIITTVTTSSESVFDGSRIKPGCHINGLGSYTPIMREIPAKIMQRADRIFVDNLEGVLAEAGDFVIPMGEGLFSADRIAGELGDLILDRVPGRTNADEITIMKSVGFATLDVVTAAAIVEKARAAGIGTEIGF